MTWILKLEGERQMGTLEEGRYLNHSPSCDYNSQQFRM